MSLANAYRPTEAKIDLGAIVSNFAVLSGFAGGKERVCAVVKADAYGHGAIPVAHSLMNAGCGRFAVSSLEEALELRDAGVEGKILTLFGFDLAHTDILFNNRITPMVSSLGVLKNLAEKARSDHLKFPLHINFDTGMGRMGLAPGDASEAAHILKKFPELKLEGVATHFSSAGVPGVFTDKQIEKFNGILAAIKDASVDPVFVHASNSAACLSEPAARYDGVRTGIALYGVLPEPGLPGENDLKPALEWTTAIEAVREVPKGTPISYGASFVTKRHSKIAVLPVGYADGYRRGLSNGVGNVLIGGARAPVVGRICMDVTLVDVTDIPDAASGDEVVLIGEQGGQKITAVETANLLQTISYEILCGIGKRVPRVYSQRL